MDRLLQMILNRALGQLINKGITHVANKGKTPAEMTQSERQEARGARKAGQRVRQAADIARKLMR